jgi:ferredoxin
MVCADGGRRGHVRTESATIGVLALIHVGGSAVMNPSGHVGEVVIDRDACMGSGNCLFWAPGVFDLDDDGVAIVSGETADREDEVHQAAANCPTAAIHLAGNLPS